MVRAECLLVSKVVALTYLIPFYLGVTNGPEVLPNEKGSHERYANDMHNDEEAGNKGQSIVRSDIAPGNEWVRPGGSDVGKE